MGSYQKDSVDVASQFLPTDKDLETASTVTFTSESTMGHHRRRQPSYTSYRQVFRSNRWTFVLGAGLWVLSLALASWLTMCLRPLQPKYSYETGFDTDLEPIRPQIAVKKVQFTGGLKFDENGTTYRAVDPTVTQYVGEPSELLDRAWTSLLLGQGVDLNGEEAKSVADLTYEKPGGWYLTGPDAFHQLHCLDVIRKALRPDYYKPANPEPVHTIHIDHCVDYIRQGVMCAADMTMIPIHWSHKRERILQDTEVTHTCRDFEKLHDWTRARNAEAHPKQS